MADRIGVISKGRLVVAEEKASLMAKLGSRRLVLHLQEPLAAVPPALEGWRLELRNGGCDLEYTFDAADSGSGVVSLLRRLGELGIAYRDLHTSESSLEDIFVSLVSERA
jgi:ABC-2 type transport system ATP-binding protein